MNIGAKGVPLRYVKSDGDAPKEYPSLILDEKFILLVTLVTSQFDIDTKNIHLIIIRNVAKYSDVYTYIKPKIRLGDGRTDMKALMKRFENKATQHE